jgi:hypothetical protein
VQSLSNNLLQLYDNKKFGEGVISLSIFKAKLVDTSPSSGVTQFWVGVYDDGSDSMSENPSIKKPGGDIGEEPCSSDVSASTAAVGTSFPSIENRNVYVILLTDTGVLSRYDESY